MTSPAEVAPEERLSTPNRSPPRRPPVTQLEFRQAMRDFRSMFPEMEAVVIEAVLRANGGAVDASIDQLLAMATDNDNERLRTELEATENAEAPPHYSPPPAAPTPPPSYQQATCTPNQGTPCTQEEARAWKPPLLGPLPPGFLRISRPHHRPSSSPPHSQAVSTGELSAAMLQQRMAENVRQQRRLSSGAAEADAQLLEDERMAILLQNQEFMRQLQSNRDFIRTLNQDIQSQEMERSAGLVPDDGRPADVSEDEPWGTLPHTEETDAAFRERLKNMGKASRRKFAQLARLFHRTKKCHFRQMLGDAANPSRDNLLLHEDPGSSEEDAEGRLQQQPTKGCPGSSPMDSR